MRCQICDRQGASEYDTNTYFCSECSNQVKRASGEVFTLANLYDILIPEDNDDSVTRIVRGK